MIKIKKERVEEYLKSKGWNQSDLAKALSFSESYITLLLNGKREASSEFIERLINLANSSFDALFFCSDVYQKVTNDYTDLPKSNNRNGQIRESKEDNRK